MTRKTKKSSWKKFPYFTLRRLGGFLLIYGIVIGLLLYFYYNMQGQDQARFQSVLLFFNVVCLEYLVFFYLPYVMFIRGTGRFIYLNLPLRWDGPFSPFNGEPLEYGAVPFRGLISYLLTVGIAIAFLVIVLFPTIYLFFGQN